MDIFTIFFALFAVLSLYFLVRSAITVTRLIKQCRKNRVIKVWTVSAPLLAIRVLVAGVFIAIGVSSAYSAADISRWLREVDEYGREEYAPVFAEEYEAGSGLSVNDPQAFLNSYIVSYTADIPTEIVRAAAFILLGVATITQSHMSFWVITENGLLNRAKNGSHTTLHTRRENGKLVIYYNSSVGGEVVIRRVPETPENLGLFGRFLIDEAPETTPETAEAPETQTVTEENKTDDNL